jgi:acetylornithine aminotransferase
MNHILPLVEQGNIEVVRAEDCFLYDRAGNRYTDFESGVWCVNLGHNNKRINRIFSQQLESVSHLGYQVQHRDPEKASEVLLEKLKLYDGQSVFLSSGSEAVDLSISLARKITGRKKICKIEGSYLSAYGYGVSSKSLKDTVSIPNNDFEKLSSTDFGEMAAFVFEPGTAWGMIRFPSEAFISRVAARAAASGSLLIVDEVTTGMGRTGKWFGFEHYGLKPDIAVCGKALGNGYPVSAVCLGKKTAGNFKDNPLRYAQSHQNDPMGCAIALGVIKEIEKRNLVTRSDEEGILFKSLLKKISLKHKKIKEVRGRGLMLAMEFDDRELAERVHRHLLDRRMICGIKGNILRFMPPLAVKHELILELIEAIDDALT